MHKRLASKCFYGDQCNPCTACDDFTPLGNYDDGPLIRQMIEKRRREFHREWILYTADWD